VFTVTSFGASLRALLGRIGLAVVLCAAVTASGVVLVNRYIDGRVDDIPRVALTTAPLGANGMNFLIIGSDSRSFVKNATDYQAFSDKATQNAPPRSDTMMVLHANGDNSFAVSFPRDLWVDIPGKGQAKLNAAFNDGPQKVVDTLQSDFNVPVNHYLEVDFETFEGIVDAIGTVPVWIPGVIKDKFTGLGMLGPTCMRLDGGRALQWVRARNIQILDPVHGTLDRDDGLRWSPLDATADIGRIKRQQDFVKKLGRIAVERTIDDPFIAPDIVDALLPNLHADQGFNRSALNQLVRAFMGLASGGAGLQFETLPWSDPGKPIGGQSVILVKHPDADAVFARLRGEVVTAPAPATTVAPGTAAPAVIRPSDVRVRVLNGSGITGAAGDADQDLSNRGFVSGGVGNATGTIAKSEIRYLPEDAGKAQLVAGLVAGADLVPDSTLVGGDVVLVLGANFKGIATAPTKDTAAPVAPTLTPEEACDQSS
jgi:LCP family protein required for cell wall assembly